MGTSKNFLQSILIDIILNKKTIFNPLTAVCFTWIVLTSRDAAHSSIKNADRQMAAYYADLSLNVVASPPAMAFR